MALKATIYKAELQIADMDRRYFADHALTIARHPSETDERMMVRLVAFALNASATMALAKGLSETDEPDLWQKDLTGRIEKWIELGQPDERRVARAAGKADAVLVFAYGGKIVDIWWQQVRAKLSRMNRVSVLSLADTAPKRLAALVTRSMRLQCTVKDSQLWISSAEADPVLVEWQTLQSATRD